MCGMTGPVPQGRTKDTSTVTSVSNDGNVPKREGFIFPRSLL